MISLLQASLDYAGSNSSSGSLNRHFHLSSPPPLFSSPPPTATAHVGGGSHTLHHPVPRHGMMAGQHDQWGATNVDLMLMQQPQSLPPTLNRQQQEDIYESIYDSRWRLMQKVGFFLYFVPCSNYKEGEKR